MKAADEEWIREIVGRELDISESATFESLDAISEAVAAITATLATKYRVLACKYLKERVPGAGFDDVKGKVAELDESAGKARRDRP